MWTAIGQAFSMVFEPYTLMVMVLASLYGLFVGAVPGLTATMATALLVPVTFFMPPIPAVAAMVTATAMALASSHNYLPSHCRGTTFGCMTVATDSYQVVAYCPPISAKRADSGSFFINQTRKNVPPP